MTETGLFLLLGTALATAVFHTLIPDHWLPFVLIGRARRWSSRTTAAVSGFSALLHTGLSAILGVLALWIGRGAVLAVGERLERASGVLLVVFGLAYALWAWRKGGHFHPGGALFHRGEEGPDCDGNEGDHQPEHLHYHADRELIRGAAGRSGFFLAVIVGLNPCVLILPLMLAAAKHGAAAVAAITLVYAATTISIMVGLSVAGAAGFRRFDPPGVARYMEAASGLLIAVVGVAFWLLNL